MPCLATSTCKSGATVLELHLSYVDINIMALIVRCVVSSSRVQMFSQVNKMSAHNLAVVLVPTLFQSMSQDLLRLTREFIIHHTLLFLVKVVRTRE